MNGQPALGFISQSAVSGAGIEGNPYQVTTSLYADLDGNNTYNAATDIKLDWTASYITSNDYFSNTFNITAPVGNTSDIKLFQHFDSYLAGDDLGPAYGVTASGTALTGTTDNPSFIGVRKNAGTPSQVQMGFVETNGNAFSSWYSGSNADPDNQIFDTGNLTNTYDTTPTTDNGLAVQYNLGTVTGTKTITNDVAFSDNAVRDVLDLPPVTPTATSSWDFVTTDYNRDGATDIVAIKKNGTGTGTTEVHIMDGKSQYKSWDLQTGTALGVTDNTWDFVKGDYNRDGATDIFSIQKIGTASGTTEVHILDAKTQYQSFVLHGDTALGMTGDNFDFQATDYNHDGITDIIAIQKSGTASGRTEIHILDGATNYKSWLLHTDTVLAPTDNTWDFQVGDYNGDGITDIIGIKKSNAGTHTTEVHVLNGATQYRSFLFQTGTAMPETGNNWDFLMDDYNRNNPLGVIGLKESDTGTVTTEAHILGASNYQSWQLQTGSVLPEVANSLLV